MTMKVKYDAPFTIIDRAVLMSEDLSVFHLLRIGIAYSNSGIFPGFVNGKQSSLPCGLLGVWGT